MKDTKENKIYDIKEINDYATKFYRDLYYDTQVIPQPKLNVEIKEPLFLTEEIRTIIKGLKNNKTMRSDKIFNE